MVMESNDLSKAILKAIIWADNFDLALSPWEIWQQCPTKSEFNEVMNCLESNNWLNDQITKKDGLVMLKGRENLVQERRRRLAAAWPKFKKIKRLTRVCSYLPFIRLVAVCNTLALAHGKPTTDLDLFIITAKNRLWSARLLCVIAAKLLGGRPTPRQATDKYCLSFYVSEENVNIQRFSNHSTATDYYLTAWTSWVLPIFSEPEYLDLFSGSNAWVKNYLPQTNWSMVAPRWLIKYRHHQVKATMETMWPDALEKILRQLQSVYLPAALKQELHKQTTSVVINSATLKFHLNDKRAMINKRFVEKLSTYGLS